MKVSTIGECGLIERIRSILPQPRDAVLGIGDDCAALRPAAGTDLLLTTDLLVEGVDFTLQTITPYRLGRKAMGVNLSDIAAMGGLPRAALAVLAMSPDGEIEFVDELYRGLHEEGVRFGVEIIGGDLSASSTLTIGVTLVGEVKTGRAVTRSGAKPGERIWVTGRLGAAAAGLAALKAGCRLRDDQVEIPFEVSESLREAARQAIERHLCPIPRIREGRALAEAGAASAMIDVSDGLALDLVRLCRESGVSATIKADRIPIDQAAAAVAQRFGHDPLAMALQGGEDFELLFTSSWEPADIAAIFPDVVTVTEVGEVQHAGQECRVERQDGSTVTLTGGYDHFGRR
ncbi:thiamine-monophosphate kinase [Candidatus Methylomirabilis lanthanidiphila]|uniref:Thiamine-monophosphate kinase n=1 Tax=Candidatus Methylomirabilis lanthanidiphila TaxID=2211376 RepID=A0A564ZIQ8_9BACT|nr:thiamine-phosphate kinase [Candidatus Methylomirabilis lanthanidiphila]VUZ85219.1 thiamine-monophosphate kinase [Candidatus Methylomirabilis lanthanidiphila]